MARKGFAVVSAPHPVDVVHAIEQIYANVAALQGEVIGDHIVYVKGAPLTIIMAEIPD